MEQVECVLDAKTVLAEGPLWDPRDSVLYWVNIKAREIHRFGLRPGDLIMEVSQERVTAPADVAAKVSEAQALGRPSVLLLVNRSSQLRFVALRIDLG